MDNHGLTEDIAYHTIRIVAMKKGRTRTAIAKEIVNLYAN